MFFFIVLLKLLVRRVILHIRNASEAQEFNASTLHTLLALTKATLHKQRQEIISPRSGAGGSQCSSLSLSMT